MLKVVFFKNFFRKWLYRGVGTGWFPAGICLLGQRKRFWRGKWKLTSTELFANLGTLLDSTFFCSSVFAYFRSETFSYSSLKRLGALRQESKNAAKHRANKLEERYFRSAITQERKNAGTQERRNALTLKSRSAPSYAYFDYSDPISDSAQI